MDIVLHWQLGGLNSILQLLVLSRLVVHRNVGCLEYRKNVEPCFIGLLDEDDEGDGGLGIFVYGQEVF